MVRPPCVSGQEAIKVFVTAGWQVARQRGSHVIMVKKNALVTLSVPDHKELAMGTLRKLIRDAGMTVEAFQGLL